MSDRDRELLEYYERHRFDDQLGYYEARSGWHRKRADLLIVLAGLVLALSSVVSLVGGMGGEGWIWPLAAAVLPAVAAALASVRSLYEFERNHSRFQETLFDLERIGAATVPSRALEGEALRAALVRHVVEVENLLSRENRQWVEFMSSVDLPHEEQA